ncbi:hypothetical protein PYCCODRAFT_1440931 [Trametes coccinea BRFM310]|uniref:Uncharacterized protein n=1 Tax=Trametes coccinea (strain BRFM310) TaxID=1353009 RepID=A0A1Y2I618_TRAC3|nr:hypothetical protein PYCCODRAFT_1440931 [Trametes coccinea BRFM310]
MSYKNCGKQLLGYSPRISGCFHAETLFSTHSLPCEHCRGELLALSLFGFSFSNHLFSTHDPSTAFSCMWCAVFIFLRQLSPIRCGCKTDPKVDETLLGQQDIFNGMGTHSPEC